MCVLDITASSYEVAESINKPKDGISKALWVAIGVLLLFGVIALVAVPCFLYRRKAKIIILNPKRSSKLLGINSPPLTEVDLNLDYGKMDLDRENPLGSGSFGVVYSGVYACMPVAVKVLSPAFQVWLAFLLELCTRLVVRTPQSLLISCVNFPHTPLCLVFSFNSICLCRQSNAAQSSHYGTFHQNAEHDFPNHRISILGIVHNM